MSKMAEFFDNFRKPADTPNGQKFLASMNKNHRKGNIWALEKLQSMVDNRPGFTVNTIVDIGCGGGQFLADLNIAWPGAKLIGIDHSRTAVDATLETNKHLFQAGKLSAYQATAEHTLLEDNSVDIVTACETIYFWPNVDAALEEVYRILRPSGLFLIWVDSTSPRIMKMWTTLIDGMRIYTREQLVEMLNRHGFGSSQYTPKLQFPGYSRTATIGIKPSEVMLRGTVV